MTNSELRQQIAVAMVQCGKWDPLDALMWLDDFVDDGPAVPEPSATKPAETQSVKPINMNHLERICELELAHNTQREHIAKLEARAEEAERERDGWKQSHEALDTEYADLTESRAEATGWQASSAQWRARAEAAEAKLTDRAPIDALLNDELKHLRASQTDARACAEWIVEYIHSDHEMMPVAKRYLAGEPAPKAGPQPCKGCGGRGNAECGRCAGDGVDPGEPARQVSTAGCVDIVFDGPPSHVSGTPKDVDEKKLRNTMDASVWAAEFVGHFGGDEGLMLGWFANAIMCGYDHAKREIAALPSSEPAPKVLCGATVSGGRSSGACVLLANHAGAHSLNDLTPKPPSEAMERLRDAWHVSRRSQGNSRMVADAALFDSVGPVLREYDAARAVLADHDQATAATTEGK